MTALANAYGHEVGIAEYVIGAILACNPDFCRTDAILRQGRWDTRVVGAPPPLWPELAGKTLGILGLRPDRAGGGAPGAGVRHGGLAIRRDPTRPDPHGRSSSAARGRWTRS